MKPARRKPVRSLRALGAGLAALLALAGTLGVAAADPGHDAAEQHAPAAAPVGELSLPAVGAGGQRVTLEARLHGSGAIAGAEVVFVSPVRFAGAEGEAVLGRAVTDEQGVARLAYVPRWEGETRVIARFAGGEQYGTAETSATMVVRPAAQLYQETAGVRVPGVNVWLLAGVLGAVWGTYLVVMVVLGLVARRGQEAAAVVAPPPGGRS